MKTKFIENKRFILILVALVIYIFIKKCFIQVDSDSQKKLCDLNEISTLENNVDPSEERLDNTIFTIFVDIKGAVKNPGSYEMKTGDRLKDLIIKAGGLTHDNLDCINLSHILNDEENIIIPEKNETCETENSLTHSSGEKTDTININIATKEELETLTGIGSTRAEDIITYRESNGEFFAIEDIKNVNGIGETTYDNIKDNISV